MGIDPGRVTAVIVTRGDVPLHKIRESLIFPNVIVWDNTERENLRVYGRYQAMKEAPTEVCFIQDDDAVIPPETQRELCARYRDGRMIANMEAERHDAPWAWMGWGSMVQRELCFLAHDACAGMNRDWFMGTGCDIAVAALVPTDRICLPFQHADYAHDRDRMFARPEHDREKFGAFEYARQQTLDLKLNLGCGVHRLPGFVNLDKETGWLWEEGIPYDDESVSAITVSHSLMYVDALDWPFVFSEFARVLKPGGIVRITEDDTKNPKSERYGGHPDAVCPTSPKIVGRALEDAGLYWWRERPGTTKFHDESLIQDYHGGDPKCFFVEAVKNPA